MRLWALVVLGCLGCAGSRPEPRAARHVAAEPAVAEAERRPYAELAPSAPVNADDSPGLWLQIAAVAHLVDKLPDGMQPLLAPYKDVGALLSRGLGADVISVVDLAQPMDITMEPTTSRRRDQVVAFRVRSPDALEQGRAGLTLRRTAPGTWLIGSRAHSESATDEDEELAADPDEENTLRADASARPPCLLVHAAPPVGFRVVCGSNRAAVAKHLAFLLRQSPAPGSDIHVELAGPVYRQRIAEAIEELAREPDAEPAAGRNLSGEMLAAASAVLTQHDRLTFDVRVSPQGADVQLDVGFALSPASELLREWLAASRTRSLPAGFARLPSDSGVALSFAGLGNTAKRQLTDRLLQALASDMADEFVVSAKEQREMQLAFADMLPDDANFSLALGADAATMQHALSSDAVAGADDADAALAPAAVESLQAALGGWLVIGVEVPPRQYLAAVERMHRVSSQSLRRRPGVQRKSTEREDSTSKRRPRAPAGLPAGTIHLVDDVRPAKTYQPPPDGSAPPILPYRRHWLFVPDGARTWIVIARSEALAAERARAMLGGAARLTERSDVRRLLSGAQPVLAALSFSMAGWTLQSLDWDSADERSTARIKLDLLGKVPRNAASPMLITLGIAEGGGDGDGGFSLRVRAELDAPALTELLMWRSPPGSTL